MPKQKSRPAVGRPRYQGLAAARRLAPEPVRPRAEFSLAVGERAGELTVIGHLARGRVTELYQVWSTEHWCALTGKMIALEHAADPGALSALHGEEEVLRKLKHPNIVRFYGTGEADGRAYLLLEYFASPSLFDLLDSLPKRRLHVPDAIRAAMHIGAAVHYLHRCGYLYRDLKPANVLLREGIPILVDFDVVRRIDSADPPADRLGTAPYMAPEQILREPLSAATDVYGLGALLYELLTGCWPMEEPSDGWEDWEDEEWDSGEVSTEDSQPTLRTADVEGVYPQLTQSPVPPRQHNARVSHRLEDITLRCLARDPTARFQTISGVLAALAPLLKGRHRLWPLQAPIERRADTESR